MYVFFVVGVLHHYTAFSKVYLGYEFFASFALLPLSKCLVSLFYCPCPLAHGLSDLVSGLVYAIDRKKIDLEYFCKVKDLEFFFFIMQNSQMVCASNPNHSHFAHLYLISSRNYQFARRTIAAKIHSIAVDLLIIGLLAPALPSQSTVPLPPWLCALI